MKGIPISADNKDKFRYEEFKNMAEKYGDVPEDEVTATFKIEKNFRISRDGEVATVPINKRLRPVINKGIVLNSGKIVPYGWSDHEWCKNNNPHNCSCKI